MRAREIGAAQGLSGALHAAGVVVGFACLYAIFFSPVWLSGGVLASGDAVDYYLPNFEWPAPAWSPLLASGFPQRADPQTAFWSPWARLFGALGGSFNAYVLSAYVLASAFTYGLARELSGSRLGGAVAGLVFGLSGQLIAHLSHTSILQSVAWLPLVIWSLERLRCEASARWQLACAAGVAACAFGGHPQYLAYTLLLGLGYASYASTRTPEPRRFLLRAGACGVLGVGLAGIALVPAAELARHSVRAELDYAAFFSQSLRLEQLPQLFFPYLFGGWHADPLGRAPLAYFARVSLNEVSAFVGLLPLVLVAVAWMQRRSLPTARFWLVVAALALLAALGRHLPVMAPLYFVPVLNKFRITARFLVLFSLAMALLSALGIASLQRLAADARRAAVSKAVTWVGVCGAGLLLAFVGVLLSERGARLLAGAGLAFADAAPWRNPLLALQLGTFALGWLALRAWCRTPSRPAVAALLLALVCDVSSFGWFYYWRDAPASGTGPAPPALAKLAAELRERHQRLTPLGVHVPPEAAPPNRSRLWGVPSTLAHGPLVLDRYAELLEVDGAGFRGFAALAPAHRGLDLLASRYLLVPLARLAPDSTARSAAQLRANLAGPRWRRAADSPGVAVFENANALPRAWLAGEVLVAAPDAVLTAIRSSKLADGQPFDPRRTALLEAPLDAPIACTAPCGSVAIAAIEDTALRLKTSARGASLLVASDIAYPGWTASVDGEPATLHRVDYVLRGVRIPAGEHDVHFAFHSRSTVWGAGVSAASAIALAIACVAGRGRGGEH